MQPNIIIYQEVLCIFSEKSFKNLENKRENLLEYFFNSEENIDWVDFRNWEKISDDNDGRAMYTLTNGVDKVLLWPYLIDQKKTLYIELEEERSDLQLNFAEN